MSTADAKEILQATFEQIDVIVKEKNSEQRKQGRKRRTKGRRLSENGKICTADSRR